MTLTTTMTASSESPLIDPAELAAQRAAFVPRPTPAHIKKMRHLLLAAVAFATASIWVALPLWIRIVEGSPAAPAFLSEDPSSSSSTTTTTTTSTTSTSASAASWTGGLLGFSVVGTVALAIWTLVHLFPQELGHVDYREEISVGLDGKGTRGPQVLKPAVPSEAEQRWLVSRETLERSNTIVRCWGASALRTAVYVAGGRAGVWSLAREGKGRWASAEWLLLSLEVGAGVALGVLSRMWAEEGRKGEKGEGTTEKVEVKN